MRRVNIGCGPYAQPDYINIDKNARWPGVDIVRDIRRGLPFDDSSVDAIKASHVLEHFTVEELMDVMEECYRVLVPNGLMDITVPLMEFRTLDHKLVLSQDSLDIFSRDADVYFNKKFKWRTVAKEVGENLHIAFEAVK